MREDDIDNLRINLNERFVSAKRTPRKAARKARLKRTAPPEHTRAEILAGEQTVIALAYRIGFEDHGRTDWPLGALDDGTVVTSDRKRYVLGGTNLRITIGQKITYLYRYLGEDRTQPIKKFNTLDIVKKPSLLTRLVNQSK